MPRNGAGTYTLPAGNPVVTGTTISSTVQNNTTSDIATALTQSIAVDGQSVVTANIPMNSNKLTGLGAATASGDALSYGQSGISVAGLTLTGALNEAQGADIASAATTNLDTATGNLVDVTGTTTITAITLSQGRSRTVRFTGSLTLTNGASLVLPGSQNIQTTPGDFAVFRGYASSVVRLVSYSRALVPSFTPPAGVIFGLTMSTAGSSATMTVAAGTAMDSTGVIAMKLLASTGKTTSAWAVGTGNGGLDTGSIANNTWYHFYQIMRPDTGVVDVVFSTNATSPTLPTNYTFYRRIGSGRTNGSAQWTSFTQDGDYFEWASPTLDVNAAAPGASAVTRTLTTPLGVSVRAAVNIYLDGTTSGDAVYLSDLATTDLAPSITASPLAQANVNAALNGFGNAIVRTNTSSQIRSRCQVGGGSNVLRLATTAWYDRRGQDA